jgi:hypothetical protein
METGSTKLILFGKPLGGRLVGESRRYQDFRNIVMVREHRYCRELVPNGRLRYLRF